MVAFFGGEKYIPKVCTFEFDLISWCQFAEYLEDYERPRWQSSYRAGGVQQSERAREGHEARRQARDPVFESLLEGVDTQRCLGGDHGMTDEMK